MKKSGIIAKVEIKETTQSGRKQMKQMKKKILTVVLAMAMVLATTACGSSANFERGTVEGNVYTNTSVGVKATVPEGLTIADDATVKEFEDAALASLDSQNISEDKKEDVANAMIYDAVITSELGSSIQIAAEDMKQTMGVKVKADAYLDSLKETTKSSYESMGCTVEFSDVDKVTLGGQEFSHIVITIDLSGMALEQEAYCRVVGNYMYYMIVTNMGDCDDAITAFFDSFEEAK